MPIVLIPSGQATATATATLVQSVRWLLEDYPMQDELTQDIGASDTSFTVQNGNKWDNGVRLEFDDGTGEQMLVRDVSSNTISDARRGVYGTTASSHTSGCFLLREPRFGYTQITAAISQAVNWTRGQVWVPIEAELTPLTTGSHFYEVPSDFVGWIHVSQMQTNGLDNLELGTPRSGRAVLVKRGLDSTLSSTGTALWIPILDNTTEEINLTYGADVTADTVPEGPITTAIVHGACAILVGAKDAPRTGSDVSQGDTTVPVGSTLRTAAWFQSMYQQYIREARIDLINNGGRLHR